MIDTNGVIQLFNPASTKITGWLAGEAVGLDYKSVLKLVDDKDVAYPEENHPFRRVSGSKVGVRDTSGTLVAKDGKHIAIDLSVSPLVDSDNNLQGAVGVFRDVTEQRRAERQRADFISTASHEMRTPVAAIEGYLALALNDKVSRIDAKARGYLEKAHESTQHLGQLFQDLLTSAKAEDGRLSSHPVVIEMGEYLEKLTEDLRFGAEKKGLALEFVVGAAGGTTFSDASKVVKPLYYVFADADRLREVITNLFDNAVKYTESGKISIGLTGDTKVVQFRIKDTGAGIPAEDQPHLFQKFYRVDSSITRTIGGTGLGLFICKKIVELYEGRIWVESVVGMGSTFFINLPRLTSDRAAQLRAQETGQASPRVVTPPQKQM
jgi:PAS domain S-box-containing protein